MGRTLLSISYTKTFNFAKMLVQLQLNKNNDNIENIENQIMIEEMREI